MIELPDRSPKIFLVMGILLSVLLHKDIFNKDLIGVHLWRQAQNEWNIRNFVRTDNNILNPRIPALNLGTDGNILRYEFPLMTWSIAQVQSLLGESILITRVIMFLVGILCIIGIYKMIGLLFQDEWLAVYTAWAFAFTPIFYYYMINPLSDVWAMCAQIWMMVFLIKYIKDLHLRHFVLSSVLLMLAGLFKLPYFMYGIMLATISVYRFFKVDHSLKILICNGFILLLISVPVVTWYWYAMKDWGYMGVIKGVFAPGGRDHLGEYIGFVFTKWLPFHLQNIVSIGFFLVGLYILISKRIFSQATRWILICGFVITVLYYIYEMNMIAKVHDYYMLPFLMWISIPVALGIQFVNLSKYKAWIIPFIIAMPFLAYSYVDSYWSIDRNGY
ncbi:MAG: glycosyltransferase family 39 protein, partial [Saprospiraceae bacterium]